MTNKTTTSRIHPGQLPHHDHSEAKKGGLAAAVAFIIWGILPVYWHWLSGIPALEILCHRIFWSFFFLFWLLWYSGKLRETMLSARDPQILFTTLCSSALLTGNWLMYIWAVTHGLIVESSLGYFITPLVNVLLGVLFFKDRPRRIQWIAVLLAVFGVLYQLAAVGSLPWIALALAGSFGLYGMMRKKASLDSLPGLFLETTLFAPPALLWLIYLQVQGEGAFFSVPPTDQALLIGAGCVTSLPLILFGYGARRLSLTTLGVLQYLAPSLSFCIGVFVYNEHFSLNEAVTFGCIWVALVIYTVEGIHTYRRKI